MDRREFIKKSGMAAVGSLLLATPFASILAKEEKKKEGIDCDGNPATPQLKDIGILASLDPVALDKACLDLVFNHQSVAGDDASPLIRRIENLHGTHTVEYADQLGLGSQKYTLVNLDEQTDIKNTESKSLNLYNVYSLDGKKLLTNACCLDGLEKGTYIVNGEKRIVE
jgi:hypothetical protein